MLSPFAEHTSCRNGQQLEVAVLSSPVPHDAQRHDPPCSTIPVTRAASALPSPQQVQLCWLQSSRPTPHNGANWQGLLAVLITLHLAFGQSEGDGALQIPLNPFSSSPARAAAPGKVLCPWRGCHGPWRLQQQLPRPWQHSSRAAACT